MKNLFLAVFILFTSVLFSQNWQSDFNDAKALAQKEHKNIILVFSGSDWCAPCIKLDSNVWQSSAFKTEAATSWVLYKADFPKKKANKLSDELTKENDALAEKYNSSGVFPLVIVLNPQGKVLGSMGYENISADAYVQKLKALVK